METALETLIHKKIITKYEKHNVSNLGDINKKSAYRNTEQVILHFPDETKLVIDCFCSGSSEDTILFFEIANE